MALAITANGPVEVSFSGTISITDPTGIESPLIKIIPVLVENMSAVDFGQAQIGITPSPVALPIIPTQLFYARNLDTKATLTVTWTPVGASSAEILVVQPGGILFFFNPASGITALSVVASADPITVDYVLAG